MVVGGEEAIEMEKGTDEQGEASANADGDEAIKGEAQDDQQKGALTATKERVTSRRNRRHSSTVHDVFGRRTFRLMYAQHFGDLTMFDQKKKRASTVICSQDCVLWTLDFSIFR